jgi:hypothetical protein
MRKRAAQELNPEMGRMGAEDPSTAFRPRLSLPGPMPSLGAEPVPSHGKRV